MDLTWAKSTGRSCPAVQICLVNIRRASRLLSSPVETRTAILFAIYWTAPNPARYSRENVLIYQNPLKLGIIPSPPCYFSLEQPRCWKTLPSNNVRMPNLFYNSRAPSPPAVTDKDCELFSRLLRALEFRKSILGYATLRNKKRRGVGKATNGDGTEVGTRRTHFNIT